MAHFAILSCNEAGHLLSIGPVGQELVRRGHRVTIVSDTSALPMARMLHLPLCAFDADQIAYPSTGRLWSTFPNFAAKAQIDMRIYIRWQAEVVLRLVPAALQELEVDGVLVDHTLAAGGTAAEHVKIPFVSIGAALLWNGEPGLPPVYTSWPYAPGHVGVWRNRLGYAGWDWFIRPTLNVINGYRARWKLPSLHGIDDTYSKLAQLSQMSPEFDFPRRQLADTCHYIGSLTADRHLTSDDEFPWERLNGRPLIVASLGTLADAENAPFFRRLVAACAGLDAQLVLALGKWHDEENDACVREGLGEVPDNVLVVDFAPQLALLDRAALLNHARRLQYGDGIAQPGRPHDCPAAAPISRPSLPGSPALARDWWDRSATLHTCNFER